MVIDITGMKFEEVELLAQKLARAGCPDIHWQGEKLVMKI